MKNLALLPLFATLLLACETHGVIENRYATEGGKHLVLQQFKENDRFFYSISAWSTPRTCDDTELKIVAMGAGGHVKVKVEETPKRAACESS